MKNKVKIISIIISVVLLVLVGFGLRKLPELISIELEERGNAKIQETNFEKVVSELTTPEKLLDYIKKNFKWKDCEGHISFTPEEFFYLEEGDCKNLATFGSYVLEQHGYDVKIMCLKLSGELKGQHAITVFRGKGNELKYITNNIKDIELIEVESFDDILIRESERIGCEITKYGFVPAGSTYVWIDGL